MNIYKKSGITLISLIVTIVLMLILAGVTVTVTLDGGLFSIAAKSNFYKEMTALHKQKSASKMINFMEQGKQNGVKSNFLAESVPVEDIENFTDTLKAEIAFARISFGEGEMLTTKQIWKDNLYNCQELFNADALEGLTKDIYYISEEASGYAKKYIYDLTSDMCYKIEDTKIKKYIVHSLEYAKFIVDGERSNGIGIVDTVTATITSTTGTKCYEPDVNKFSYKTEVVYYSPDFKDEHTITVKEYLEKGKPSTLITKGQVYTFANYVPKGSDEPTVWANIKTTANGIEAYWTWIPRYAYKLDASVAKKEKSDIIFIDINNKQMDGTELPEGYVVHEAFEQKPGLKGIWFSKYEPSSTEVLPVDYTEPNTPNLENFVPANTKLIYYTLDGKNSIEQPFSLTPEQTVEQDGKIYYFYNYASKIWANVKCNANGLESYWVWIPRFAYKLEGGVSEVLLIDINNVPLDKTTYGTVLPQGYKVHDAFLQEPGIQGLWFSKYEPSYKETTPIDKSEPQTPNLANFNPETTKLIYYTLDGKNSIEQPFSLTPAQTVEQEGKTYYFYNYANKIWANIKCSENEIISYWTWIPRFAYKIEGGVAYVILVDENDRPINTSEYGLTLPETYTVHEAFNQEGLKIKGLWFSKYEPSQYIE